MNKSIKSTLYSFCTDSISINLALRKLIDILLKKRINWRNSSSEGVGMVNNADDKHWEETIKFFNRLFPINGTVCSCNVVILRKRQIPPLICTMDDQSLQMDILGSLIGNSLTNRILAEE